MITKLSPLLAWMEAQLELIAKLQLERDTVTAQYEAYDQWLRAQPCYDPKVYYGYDALEASRLIIAKLTGLSNLDWLPEVEKALSEEPETHGA